MSCTPKTQKIVYFKEPKYEIYETSKHHLHGKKWNSHFIPNNHEKNHILVDHYDKLWEEYQRYKVKDLPLYDWLISYLIIGLLVIGVHL